MVTLINGVTIDIDGEQVYDYYWYDPQGNIVAYTDLQFRDTVFENLINRYNNEVWGGLDEFGVVSPVVGFDFYHYKNNFWGFMLMVLIITISQIC